MTQRDIGPQRVVLSTETWIDELAGELIRLGIKREKARDSAVDILRRILGRSDWPGNHFRVDDRALLEEGP